MALRHVAGRGPEGAGSSGNKGISLGIPTCTETIVGIGII